MTTLSGLSEHAGPPRMLRNTSRLLAFADIADTGENFTLVTGRDDDGVVRIDLIDERIPPFHRDKVIKEFCDQLRKHGIAVVGMARYSSKWGRDRFRRHGIACQPGEQDRPDVLAAFLKRLDAGAVVLPEHDGLAAQLRALRLRAKEHGGPDNLVGAVAGIVDLANSGPRLEKVDG